ncbi:hypothetical protein GWI33_019548 [Rhynchophorus ferrugineus]|uniref:Uncharacterized protein n=1 Tax=Rhynchophorus ferrugineus TaxID=354439 RepID=A0A834HSP3_RHYFE|nr:hypothetical protein GWI33_019548 [Rhynchophorus ferrugineus]
MSTAMRSTLQTVPESLEVTKTTTVTQDVPATSSTKTPAKTSADAVATKSSRSYHAPSSTNRVSVGPFT